MGFQLDGLLSFWGHSFRLVIHAPSAHCFVGQLDARLFEFEEMVGGRAVWRRCSQICDDTVL